MLHNSKVPYPHKFDKYLLIFTMPNIHVLLEWQDGQPYSTKYADVYFSRDSGLDETRHVFLAKNQLQQRWQALESSRFTIAETGFGSGLNFLCAWQLWNECAPQDARLHFISTEKYPLSPEDLKRALNLWPQLAGEAEQLFAQYQWLTPGFHQLKFEQGHVTLTLLIGDVQDTLPLLRANVDAWFLDGFAPAKNPGMWQQPLFESMARLSHAQTTFATFTSAGDVRRGLQSAGFTVNKVTGFGRKREMLCGYYAGAGHSKPTIQDAVKDKRAIVIGGGIAGTASSHALATRGWQVTLIERHSALAQEASGNTLGVLYPRLSGQDIALSLLALHGYLHTLRLLQGLKLDKADYANCGLLQLAFDARELERCGAIAARGLVPELVSHVNSGQASQFAGIKLAHGGLYFPSAGWVSPPAFCRALAKHDNIKLMTSTHALRLQRHDDLWQVWDASSMLAEAPVLIVASASDSVRFEQTSHLPLEPVRGQITTLADTPASQPLKTVICTDGYISPTVDGIHSLGATFSADDHSNEIRESDHLSNLAMLRRLSPELYQSLSPQLHGGRVAFRSTTPDYLPMAGAVIDAVALAANPPRHNANPANLPWLNGLYINAGHGSKGLINAPLCAEILACAINGEPIAVDTKLLAALDPNRFLLRKMGLKRLLQGLAVHPVM